MRVCLFFLLCTSFLYGGHYVIEGGGPVGLLTALKLEEAGHEVTLVNDRLRYTRRQIISVDPEWVALLQRVASEPLGERMRDGVIRPTVSGWMEMPIHELEKLLFGVLQERAAVRLLYGYRVVDIEGAEALLEGPEKLAIPFEGIYFCGGENDTLRTKHLSVPSYSRSPIKYSLYIFDRKEWLPMGESDETQSGIMDKFSFCEPSVKERLGVLVDLLEDENPSLAASVGHVLYRLAHELEDHTIEFRLFENSRQLYLAFEINCGYFDWLVDLASDSGRTAAERKWLKEIVGTVNRVVLSDIMRLRGVDEEAFILDEKHSATFAVEQMVVPRVAATLAGTNAFGVALGDALVSPHFFTGSGLTFGRECVECALKALKGECDLAAALRDVQARSLGKGVRPGQRDQLPFPEKVMLFRLAEKPLEEYFKPGRVRIYRLEEHRYLLEREGRPLKVFTVEVEEVRDRFSFYRAFYRSDGRDFDCLTELLIAE